MLQGIFRILRFLLLLYQILAVTRVNLKVMEKLFLIATRQLNVCVFSM